MIPNKVKNFEYKNWKISSLVTPILNAQELEDFSDRLHVFAMPEMIFNSNLVLEHTTKNFCLSFNAYDALEDAKSTVLHQYRIPNVKVGCAWSDKTLPPNSSSPTVNGGGGAGDLSTQFTARINLQQSDAITPTTISPNNAMEEEASASPSSTGGGAGEKIEERQDNIDWTFTSLYRGSILRKSGDKCDDDDKGATGATSGDNDCSEKKRNCRVSEHELLMAHDKWINGGQRTVEQVNFERLKQQDEILFYDDVLLYQDELHDHGESRINVKTRVMSHGFFCLLRFFMRVDGVCVRIIDTRLYHDFESEVVVREFSWHESSWEDIARRNAIMVRDPAAMDDPQRLLPVLQLRAKQVINIPL